MRARNAPTADQADSMSSAVMEWTPAVTFVSVGILLFARRALWKATVYSLNAFEA